MVSPDHKSFPLFLRPVVGLHLLFDLLLSFFPVVCWIAGALGSLPLSVPSHGLRRCHASTPPSARLPIRPPPSPPAAVYRLGPHPWTAASLLSLSRRSFLVSLLLLGLRLLRSHTSLVRRPAAPTSHSASPRFAPCFLPLCPGPLRCRLPPYRRSSLVPSRCPPAGPPALVYLTVVPSPRCTCLVPVSDTHPWAGGGAFLLFSTWSPLPPPPLLILPLLLPLPSRFCHSIARRFCVLAPLPPPATPRLPSLWRRPCSPRRRALALQLVHSFPGASARSSNQRSPPPVLVVGGALADSSPFHPPYPLGVLVGRPPCSQLSPHPPRACRSASLPPPRLASVLSARGCHFSPTGPLPSSAGLLSPLAPLPFIAQGFTHIGAQRPDDVPVRY